MQFIVIPHWTHPESGNTFVQQKKKQMAVKKTIAIVGATEKEGRKIANQFACMPYRFLFISNKTIELEELTNNILQKNPEAEIEILECVKDGCWEADIIILAVAAQQNQKVAGLIKEVATQKIVVEISDKEKNVNELQKILPYSKLVKVSGNFQSQEIEINGDDETVNEEIMKIFKQAGYKVKIPKKILSGNEIVQVQ